MTGMNNPFVRWWITFSIMIIAMTTTLIGGIGSFIVASDQTWLSWGILAVFLGASGHLGYLIKGKSKNFDVTEYFAEMCTSLGLLGTIIGLILMIVGAFADLDITNQESIKQALVSMSSGIGTALVTTLVGLVCALALRFQLVVAKKGWKA